MIVFGLPLRRASERKKPGLRTPLLASARSERVPLRPLLGERHFAMQMGVRRGVRTYFERSHFLKKERPFLVQYSGLYAGLADVNDLLVAY